MAVNLIDMTFTAGDVPVGITLETGHCVMCVLSVCSFFLPTKYLMAWVIVSAFLSYALLRDKTLYTDARLLWQGVGRLRGLTIKQATKQASLIHYLDTQNPFVSWIFSYAEFHVFQGVFLAMNTLILLLLLDSHQGGVRLLLATPFFALFRTIPSHDSLFFNLGLLAVLLADFSLVLATIAVLLGVWVKVLSVGFPRIVANQKKAVYGLLLHRVKTQKQVNAQTFGISSRHSIVTKSVFLLPSVMCFWFFFVFSILSLCRIEFKYYLWFLPLVVL